MHHPSFTAAPHRSALDASVLVLNRSYLPVHVTTARRAFRLLYLGHAEALLVVGRSVDSFDLERWLTLDRNGNKGTADLEWVRTVRRRVGVPRIVRLKRYDRPPHRRVGFSRRNVLLRDRYVCQYCGERPPAPQITLDHVVPRSRGGRHSWTNVVCCCRRCNDRKGNRAPGDAGLRLQRSPRAPSVSPLFVRRLTQPRYRSWRMFVDPLLKRRADRRPR